LGLDIGTGGIRALVLDERGRIVASATEDHEAFSSPGIGWAEQRPEDWRRACGIAVRNAYRFGSANLKPAFWLVKFLEGVGYSGPRHFDAHAYRTENYERVKDFARGCMRTYLILKEKARLWNADREIQALLKEISAGVPGLPPTGKYSTAGAAKLFAHPFDRAAIAPKRLPYERLDQLTVHILLRVR
jgi:FGGY family of carbohydrate kinases, N-terminal domain